MRVRLGREHVLLVAEPEAAVAVVAPDVHESSVEDELTRMRRRGQ